MRHLHPRQWFTLIALFACAASPSRGADIASSASTAATARGASIDPAISSDGRYVAFASTARLSGSDKNTISDVYLKDRKTGAIRRISDDRGGDQPTISATGQFVVYRSLDDPPQARIVDLVNPAEPRTVSYPFPSGHSFRTALRPQISPEGRFVSFIFDPVPTTNSDPSIQLCVNNTFEPDRLSPNAAFEPTSALQIFSMPEAVVNRSANSFFIVTNDALANDDTNGRSDIYRVFNGVSFVNRVTQPDPGLLEDGEVRNPALSADGSTLFFISERQLKAADQDGRATIYTANISNGFVVPVPIATDVEPVALSRQATSDGRFLAFLGKNDSGALGIYVLEVATGKLLPVGRSGLNGAGAPVISANNAVIAFSTSSSLLGWDGNGAPDVYVFPNPHQNARITAPTATLVSPDDGTEVAATTAINFSGTGASSEGAMFYTGVQIDGVETVSGTTSASVSRTLDPGNYAVRTVAIDNANVASVSSVAQLTVRPAAGQVAITDLRSVKKSVGADGSTSFKGVLEIDNNSNAARGPFRIVLLETPGPAKWENFGDPSLVPPAAENLLGVITRDSLGADSQTLIPFSSTFSPAAVFGPDQFQGLAWAVTARLEELVNDQWQKRDSVKILDILPDLNESTPGPNGGVPISGVDPDADAFNPALLQSISIIGPKKIASGVRSKFRAVGVFSTGNKPITPKWQVVSGGPFASISGSGILKTVPVGTPQVISIRASFLGQSKTINVLSTPVSPRIAVRASTPFATENGSNGEVRFTRTPVTSEPVTVNYTVSGSAVAGTNFQALPGTVVIPGGQAAVNVSIVPLNNAEFDGRTTVTVSVAPSVDYRLAPSKSATVFIDDDEAFPNGQPDAVIQADFGAAVGEFMVDNPSSSLEFQQQQVFVNTTKTKPVNFTVEAVNRGTDDAFYKASGPATFLGFVVTYTFDGGDVTAAVTDGTFQFPSITPGASATLQVTIQPTADTPAGAVFRCPIRIIGTGGFDRFDKVEAVVTRVK